MEKKLQLLPLSEHEAGVLRKFLKSIIPLFKEAKVSGFMEQTMLEASALTLENILNKLEKGAKYGGDESGRLESSSHK